MQHSASALGNANKSEPPIALSHDAWSLLSGQWQCELDWRSNQNGADSLLRMTASRKQAAVLQQQAALAAQVQVHLEQRMAEGAEGKEKSAQDPMSGLMEMAETNASAGFVHSRTLEYRRGDFFLAAPDAAEADIVVCETMIPPESYERLYQFLGNLKTGCRILTFCNLDALFGGWRFQRRGVFWRQLEINKPKTDVFITSWNSHYGHHFFVYIKVPREFPAVSDPSLLSSDRRPAELPYAYREQHDHLRKLGYDNDVAIEEFLFAAQGQLGTVMDWLNNHRHVA
jgi:hypothetical protein